MLLKRRYGRLQANVRRCLSISTEVERLGSAILAWHTFRSFGVLPTLLFGMILMGRLAPSDLSPDLTAEAVTELGVGEPSGASNSAATINHSLGNVTPLAVNDCSF